MLRILPALIFLISFLEVSMLAAEDLEYLREARFREAIDRPLVANGERAVLRDYLQRLAGERQVAILLDRRIDPGQRVNVALAADFFDDGIRSLVGQVAADVSVVGDTIYVGPPESTRLLRTRIAIARNALDGVQEFTPRRQFEILRRYEVHWPDLTSPREIVQEIARRYDIKIEGIAQIPHDLWGSGSIAYPNLIEALTLVLTQFHLGFEWKDATTIRIDPEVVALEIQQRHRPRGMSLDAAMDLITREHPTLPLATEENQLLISGTVEQHESVAILLGEKPPRQRSAANVESAALRNRRFTLKMVRKPFGSLMATLQQQGITIQYDPRELNKSGIDLAQKISLELEQATIDQLLEQSCEKVGLTYRIEGETVLLKVAD